LYTNPINLFVATFVGSPPMNLFRGLIEKGMWQGENFGGYPVRKDLPDGTRVTAGVRPESIHLSKEGIYGVVEEVTPFFAERHQLITVHLAGEQWLLVAPFDQPVEVGSTIQCTLDPESVLYFDTKTGQRIG
jgi:multiple sugar transport system ATP-binding protein